MKNIRKAWIWILFPVLIGTSSAFIFPWPWNFLFPGQTTQTTGTVAAATINYGFLRPSIFVPVPTTTTAATTTTTTVSTNQLFINALLASSLPVANNSPLFFANALANRPIFGGLARPNPIFIGGGGTAGVAAGFPATGQFPQAVGGVASPIGGGVGGGGFVLPQGFPASGGVAASGVLPGFFGGGFGRSSRSGEAQQRNSTKAANSGRVVFAAKK